MIFMYAIVGPFAIVKLYAKNLMRRAYKNQILVKLLASMLSLTVGSQIAYEYRSSHAFLCFIYGLLAVLLNYWYIIPLLLIYLFPITEKFARSWLRLIDFICETFLRPYSTKFRQQLPAIWTFEVHNEKFWPIESIRFMLTYGSAGPALYFGYQFYKYLFFGISFNLCLAIALTILLQLTFWHLLEAIDKDLYPFIFAIIVQYYIVPYRSSLNIPLTILLTTFLFPLCNNLLTSQSIRNLIQNMKLLNFRTFFESNANYKLFFTEFVNLVLTIYLTYSIFRICLQSQVSYSITFGMILFLLGYFYTNLIRIIRFEPNTIMFLFSSFLLANFILQQRTDKHFIYNFFLIIMILTFYFALIYPFLYHILRRSVIKSAQQLGLNLKFFREKIFRLATNFHEKYFRIISIDQLSKNLVLHLCNLILTISILIFFPMNILIRLFISLIIYLLVGRLLLTHGLDILANLISLSLSFTAGAHVYGVYDQSICLTMSIALITYLSTYVISFPLAYRLIQFLISHAHRLDYFERLLQRIFDFSWSYFEIVWPHILVNFNQVKKQIEQSRLNLFRRSTNQ